MRKKLLTALITMSLLTTLVGCGSSNAPSSNTDNNESAVETKNNEDKVNNDTEVKNPTDNNKKEDTSDTKTNGNSVAKNNNDKSSNNSSSSAKTNDNTEKINKDNKANSTNSNNNSNTTNKENSKNEATKPSSEENKKSETQSPTKNDNLSFQSLAEIIAKKEFQSDNIGNVVPVKVTKKDNDLTFEKDESSNVFLNTSEGFSKDPKEGLLILILPEVKKEGDKTYHSFKLSSVSMIENGGTGTVDIGRVYNDGTVKFGEF